MKWAMIGFTGAISMIAGAIAMVAGAILFHASPAFSEISGIVKLGFNTLGLGAIVLTIGVAFLLTGSIKAIRSSDRPLR